MPCVGAVVVIGYSFGRYRGRIDDAESATFFIELLRRYPKRVTTVDPFPEPVAAMIEDGTRQEIMQCPIFWDKLAASLCAVAAEHPGVSPYGLRREISTAYLRQLH
jgi:hypothetical protein